VIQNTEIAVLISCVNKAFIVNVLFILQIF